MQNILKAIIIFISIQTITLAYTDPKIGGTISVDNKFILERCTECVLTISVYKDSASNLIAKNIVKGALFPQAFVITPKNLLTPSSSLEGKVLIKVEYLYNKVDARRFTNNKSFMNAYDVGTKDIQIQLHEN